MDGITSSNETSPDPPLDKYAFQKATIDRALSDEMQGVRKKLIVSPTGSGKTTMMMDLRKRVGPSRCIVVTPSPELIPDYLDKLGLKCPETKPKMMEFAESINIYSAPTLRNRFANGKSLPHVTDVILDEAHHNQSDTFRLIAACLPESVREHGFTATDYCGTPLSTRRFREHWDDIYYAISFPEAVETGVISFPAITVLPLVDDDLLELRGGEFEITTVESKYKDKMEHAFGHCYELGWFDGDGTNTPGITSGNVSRCTVFGLPSSKLFEDAKRYADRFNFPIEFIDQSTTHAQRVRIFKACRNAKVVLGHIYVVSEGKDIPVRNYLDLAPCMSPRLFFQRFGRCTRPLRNDEQAGTYICTNRNIERHMYLFEGVLPAVQAKAAIAAFPESSTRSGTRAIGLESLGRIRPVTVKLAGGGAVTIYNVTQMKDGKKQTFMCLLHPQISTPFWFESSAGMVNDGVMQRMAYTRWKMVPPPDDLQGFQSSKPHVLTERQMDVWKKNAERLGLDPAQKVDARKFSIVMVLLHCGISLAD